MISSDAIATEDAQRLFPYSSQTFHPQSHRTDTSEFREQYLSTSESCCTVSQQAPTTTKIAWDKILLLQVKSCIKKTHAIK